MRSSHNIAPWPKTTIGKSSYLRGRIGWQGLRASEFSEDGPFLVTGTDFENGKIKWENCYHISDARFAEAAYIHLQNEDVLVTKDGTIGKVAIVENCPSKAVLNSGIFLLRSQNGSYEQRYLYYLLQSRIFRTFLDDTLAGSTIQHLYQHVFKTFEFSVPQRKEQKQIADVLIAADSVIKQTEAQIIKENRIKSGLMHDLLTFGVDEGGNVRSQKTHKFKDSPLGRIPAEWEVHPISKFGSKSRPWLRTGPFGSDLNTKHWVPYGIPVLTIGSLGEGEVIESELLYVNQTVSETLKAFRVSPGDIVFSRVADIGRSLVIRPHQVDWIISSNLMRISLDTTRANPEFLYRNIASNPAVRSQLRTASNFGGRELVNGPILAGLIFPWPDKAEQDRIVSRLSVIDENIRTMTTSLNKTLSIKSALMQDLLTGQKRVTSLLEGAPQFMAEAT